MVWRPPFDPSRPAHGHSLPIRETTGLVPEYYVGAGGRGQLHRRGGRGRRRRRRGGCHHVDVPSKNESVDLTAPTQPRTAEDECAAVAASIGKKADKNKRRARAMTIAMTVSTASIPVLIGLSGDDFWWGRFAPSVLAAISALLVALNGLERPHERWVLYRRYQRLVQAEAKKYRFNARPYDGRKRDRLLATNVAQLELDLQMEWEGLIPSRFELASAGSVPRGQNG